MLLSDFYCRKKVSSEIVGQGTVVILSEFSNAARFFGKFS